MNTATKRLACNMCTFKCVKIAYQRAPWFRLVRGPMVIGMHLFVAVHRVNVKDYPFPTASCSNCIRFYKSALFKRSPSFRWLHGRVNPVFNYFMDRIVTKEERKQAHLYAVAASAGTLSEKETREWMQGMKTGL